jgi:hypothetical protein
MNEHDFRQHERLWIPINGEILLLSLTVFKDAASLSIICFAVSMRLIFCLSMVLAGVLDGTDSLYIFPLRLVVQSRMTSEHSSRDRSR